MKVVRGLCSLMIASCGFLQASEYSKGYTVDQTRVSKQPTQGALEYERAYNKDTKIQTAGFYNRLKNALGFRFAAQPTAAQPRPRVAEYEKAFSTHDYKNEPWNTQWYEKRTYKESLPADVKKALDTHQEEVRKVYNVSSFEWLPGYIVKRETPVSLSRIEGAKRFTSAIKTERNPMLYIPQKYKYTPVGFSESEGSFVISEEIPRSNDPITKDEAKAIKRIAQHTRWKDARGSNIFKISSGRLGIIDTESRFYPQGYRKKFVKQKVTQGMLYGGHSFSQEARDYLENKYKKYKNPKSSLIRAPSKGSFYSRMGL